MDTCIFHFRQEQEISTSVNAYFIWCTYQIWHFSPVTNYRKKSIKIRLYLRKNNFIQPIMNNKHKNYVHISSSNNLLNHIVNIHHYPLNTVYWNFSSHKKNLLTDSNCSRSSALLASFLYLHLSHLLSQYTYHIYRNVLQPLFLSAGFSSNKHWHHGHFVLIHHWPFGF